jgi:hypothetical protein
MATAELSFPLDLPGLTDGVAQTHDLIHLTPGGQERNAYSILIPKGWTAETDLGEQPVDAGALTRIGFFHDRVGPDAAIVQVCMTQLPLEVGLRDWVQFQAGQFAVQLTVCREVQFTYGLGVDAGGWAGPPDNRHVARLVAFVDEGRIFVCLAMVRKERYPALIRDFTIATQSFSLVHPTDHHQLEQWLCGNARGAASFRVAFPASWVSRNVNIPVRGKTGFDVLLLREEELQAYLRIKAIHPSIAGGDLSDGALLRVAAEELAEANLRLTGSWTSADEPMFAGLPDLTGFYFSPGTFGKVSVEFRCALLERGGLRFVLTLLSGRKIDDPIVWMRARRALEIALSTVEPLPPSSAPSANGPRD